MGLKEPRVSDEEGCSDTQAKKRSRPKLLYFYTNLKKKATASIC